MSPPHPASRPAPRLVAVGALNVDLVFRLHGAAIARASNVATLERRAGGVAGNVARAFAAAAPHLPAPWLVAAAGDDPLPACEGVELLPVPRPGWANGTYAAVLDADGELHVGFAATGIVETLAAADVLERLREGRPGTSPRALLLDANLSATCLADLAAVDGTLVAMAVSPGKALRLAPIAARVDCLFCNRREAAALAGGATDAPLETLADALTARGWRRFVLTDGPEDLIVAEPGSRERLATTATGASAGAGGAVNGAGDALAGATLVHWLAGAPLARAVADAGLPAAARHLAHSRPRRAR